MSYAPYNRAWENWAPVVARLFLAIQFGIAAFFKVVAFSSSVTMTGAAGVPLPTVAVVLALILEVFGIIALLTGWKIRVAAALLAPYVLLLAVIFYHNFADFNTFGEFVSHLGLAAALLYVSVYGAKYLSVDKS